MASTSAPLSQAQKAVRLLEGDVVRSTSVHDADLSLSVAFERGTLVTVQCSRPAGSAEALACWEFFTADGQCLEVWPGGQWHFSPYETT